MSPLMVSVSGVRGTIGDALRPGLIVRYVQAFAKLIGRGTVVLGRDSRLSGEMIEHLVTGTLLASGCGVRRLGIATTPTSEVMVTHTKACGGIIITASHNPPQWNALKFLGKDGMFLRKAQVEQLDSLLTNESFSLAAWDEIPGVQDETGAFDEHLRRILALPYLDLSAIRKRRFHVALDTTHGAAGPSARKLLEALGCQVTGLGFEPTGRFAHPCEPVPENLTGLGETVLRENADVGFAIDPDGDRLALVSEQGAAIGEEYTLAIAARCVLSKKKGPITLNLSTSRMAQDVAASFGCETFRTAVGEINVSSAMKENGSVLGGEGNGGAMVPEVLYGRDAHVGMALCLQHLCERKTTISDLVAQLPRYVMRKEKIELGRIDPAKAMTDIESRMPKGDVDRVDGLRIAWSDSWIHVRKSNTEPIFRIMIEAADSQKAENLSRQVRQAISGS